MQRIPMLVRRVVLASALATVAAAALLWSRGRSVAPASATSHPYERRSGATAILVDVVPARMEVVQEANSLSGQVQSYHVATISAELPGRILSRPVVQGERVSAGALLAALDSRTAAAVLSQAQNAHAQAVAARRQAEAEYTRAFVETDAARQQASAQVEQASADKRRAKAQLVQAAAGERKVRDFTRAQELGQAEAALTQAKTDERLARLDLDRYSYLAREGAIAQQMLDKAQATLDSAAARRQSAEQAVSLAREGARREDQEAAAAQSSAAEAQVEAAAHQVDAARANVRVAGTRDSRLAVIRRQIDGLRAQEAESADAARQAQIALDKLSVRAPFPGRVLATLAESGDMMAAGTPIARLGEIDRVKVTFAVPEVSRPLLRLGQPVMITADALKGRLFTGRITTLGFQADPRSRAFPIEVTVRNPDEALLPNMVARLKLPVGAARRRLLIPSSAVMSDGAITCVFVLSGDHALRRDVKLGAPAGDQVEVEQGLAAGERIAATPQRLSDGAVVQVAGGDDETKRGTRGPVE